MKTFFKSPKFLFPLFMAFCMAFVMSGLMTLINLGFVSAFFFIWMKNFGIGFCCAFPVAFFLAPAIRTLVERIAKS